MPSILIDAAAAAKSGSNDLLVAVIGVFGVVAGAVIGLVGTVWTVRAQKKRADKADAERAAEAKRRRDEEVGDAARVVADRLEAQAAAARLGRATDALADPEEVEDYAAALAILRMNADRELWGILRAPERTRLLLSDQVKQGNTLESKHYLTYADRLSDAATALRAAGHPSRLWSALDP
jgi:hypothetical protein